MRNDVIVHIVDTRSPSRAERVEELTSSGYRVHAHDSPRSLIDDPCLESRPGCVVASLHSLPEAAVEVLATLRDRGHYLPMIVAEEGLTVPAAMRLVRAGAVDVILDPCPSHDLCEAIDRGLRLARLDLASESNPAQLADRLDRLTDRERRVLDELLHGLTNKEIARDLGISPRTVEVHRSRIMVKMEARGLPHLFRMVFAPLRG